MLDKELTPNNTAIGIADPGGVHGDAGITVDFRILEGTSEFTVQYLMRPNEAPAPPSSASPSAASASVSTRASPPAANGDEDVQLA